MDARVLSGAIRSLVSPYKEPPSYFYCLVGVPFDPLKVKLLAGDLKTGSPGREWSFWVFFDLQSDA